MITESIWRYVLRSFLTQFYLKKKWRTYNDSSIIKQCSVGYTMLFNEIVSDKTTPNI